MDDRLYTAFDRIYTREYDPEVLSSGYFEAREMVDRVDEALRSADFSLRPDGKVALLSNALSLGVLPCRLAALNPDEWRPALEEDLHRIAFEAGAAEPGQEISSGAIVASAARNWTELKTAALEFWD